MRGSNCATWLEIAKLSMLVDLHQYESTAYGFYTQLKANSHVMLSGAAVILCSKGVTSIPNSATHPGRYLASALNRLRVYIVQQHALKLDVHLTLSSLTSKTCCKRRKARSLPRVPLHGMLWL